MRSALALSVVILVALAGCGDDGDSGAEVTSGPAPTGDVSLPTSAPSPTAAVPAGIQHPLGAEDVVLSIGYEGGFVPVGVSFANIPTLLVTGDGHVIVSGPQTAIYPGPMLPNLLTGPIDEATIQELLRSAQDHGLFADVEYARNDLIADASDLVVRIQADGATYEHRAYALGLEDETDPARAALAEFVAEATTLTADVTASASTPYQSDAFLIQARPVTPEELGDEIEPTVVTWPADQAVGLAGAAVCSTLPWADGEALFADATQLTLFDDGGTTYQITALPRLPGRSC